MAYFFLYALVLMMEEDERAFTVQLMCDVKSYARANINGCAALRQFGAMKVETSSGAIAHLIYIFGVYIKIFIKIKIFFFNFEY